MDVKLFCFLKGLIREIIMKGDDLLSHRYLLFCSVVAPLFAIIALYKQSAFPEKEPEAVMKAIFPRGVVQM
jgi:hypothetical protein